MRSSGKYPVQNVVKLISKFFYAAQCVNLTLILISDTDFMAGQKLNILIIHGKFLFHLKISIHIIDVHFMTAVRIALVIYQSKKIRFKKYASDFRFK